MRRRKSRTARLQMTCPEKHRERDRFTGNENRAPQRTFSAPTLALKSLKLLPMQPQAERQSLLKKTKK